MMERESNTSPQQPPVKGKRDFRKIFWNPETRQILTRTCGSWAKIGAFYLIFYSALALLFFVMMTIFYQTLDTERNPTLVGGWSCLKDVGIGLRPRTILHKGNLFIHYEPSQPSTSTVYVDSIDDFLQKYNASRFLKNASPKNCSFDMYEQRGHLQWNDFCDFDFESLGSCGRDDRWGYDTNSPCVFITINKVIDWEPQTIQNLTLLPTGLQQHILASTNKTEETLARHIWVWCQSNQTSLEQPSPGIPYYYFPYLNQPGYLKPIVPIRVLNLTKDKGEVKVKCQAWAQNIKQHFDRSSFGEVNVAFQID